MHISNISKPNASSINFYLLKTWWAQESTSKLSIFTKIVTLKGNWKILTSGRNRNCEQKTNQKHKSKHGHLHKQKPR